MAKRPVTSEPGTSEAILRDHSSLVVPYADSYRLLGERLGVDFSEIILAMDNVPLCLNGEEHTASRKLVAKMIAENTPAARAASPALVAKNFQCLTQAGEHDLLADAIVPLTDQFLSVLIGADVKSDAESFISRMFSETVGIAKRRKINKEVAELRQSIETVCKGASAEIVGAKMAIAILGRDTLVGTIARSLNERFQQFGGTDQRTCPMTSVPSHTGLPRLGRVAGKDIVYPDISLPKGAEMLVRLDTEEGYGDARERMKFFGLGAHTCLGRPLTLALWKDIQIFLNKVETKIETQMFALRPDDIFAFPGTFTVKVS